MGDKGEGGVKNLKKWVMSFMEDPYTIVFFWVVYVLEEERDTDEKITSFFAQSDFLHYILHNFYKCWNNITFAHYLKYY